MTLLGVLLPVALLLGVLFWWYLNTRKEEIERRNVLALSTVVHELDARLEAGTSAWLARATGSASEPIDLPGLARTQPIRCAASAEATTEAAVEACDRPPGRVAMRLRGDRIRLKAPGVAPPCDVSSIALRDFVRGAAAVPAVFDTFLVATRSGTVLGHAADARLPISSLRDVSIVDTAGTIGGPVPVPLDLAARHNVTFRSTRHVLYAAHWRTIGTTELLVVAAVEYDKLSGDLWVLPYWWVVSLAFVLVLAALSWPVLKLWFMGPSERLRSVDVRILAVTSLLAAAVVAVAVTGAVTVRSMNRVLDERTRTLSSELDARLQRELDGGTRQLVDLASGIRARTVNPEHEAGSPVDCGGLHCAMQGRHDVAQALLLDGRGNALCRWDPDPSRTHLTLWSGTTPCLRDRQYYKDVRTGEPGWVGEAGGIERYAVEVVRSKLDGTDVLAIAAPAAAELASLVPFDQRPLVMLVSRPLAAFHRPILPPGFAFAVVDRRGIVQLQSDPNRGSGQNLFDQMRQPYHLRALLESGRSDFTSVDYDGSAHRVLVRPMGTGAWRLVVMRSEDRLRALLTEIMTVWAAGFALFLVPCMLALGALQIVEDDYQGPWLWPSRTDVGARGYGIVAAAVLAGAALMVAAYEVTGWWRWIVLLSMPWVAMWIAYRTLASVRRRSAPNADWQAAGSAIRAWSADRERHFRGAYVCMVWALLVAMSGIPAALLWIDVSNTVSSQFDAVLGDDMATLAGARRVETRELCMKNAERCPLNAELEIDRGTFPWKPAFTAPRDEPAVRPFSASIQRLLPLGSEFAARLRAVPAAMARPLGMSAIENDAGGLAILPRWAPVWLAVAVVAIVLALVAITLVGMSVVWSVVIRLFLLDADRPDAIDAAPAPPATTAVWVHRRNVDEAWVGDLPVLDLRWTAHADAVTDWFRRPQNAAEHVIVGLESRLGDGAYEGALLDQLEPCVARGTRLALVSGVDPLQRLDALLDQASADRAALSARWTRIFSRLQGGRVDVAHAPADPAHQFLRGAYPVSWSVKNDVVDDRDETTAAWYRTLWDTSTPRERLAMRHLADESFLNPNDVDTARSLFRRRLIVRDRQIDFVTCGLRRFVRRATPDAQVAEWEKQLGESTWAQLNPMLQGSLAIVGAVLLWTQEELRTSAIAVPAAVTSVLPLLVRVLGKLGGDSRQSPDGK